MPVIKKGKSDVHVFNRHKNKDPNMQYVRDNKYLDDMCDLAQTLKDPNWKYEDKATGPLKEFIDVMKETGDFKELQSVTVGDSSMSYYASKKICEDFYKERFKQKSKDKQRADIRNLVKEVSDKVEKLDEAMKHMFGGGCGLSGRQETKVPREDQMFLAERMMNDAFFAKIFEMIGRMRSMANNKIRVRLRGQDKMVGLCFGNDLENVLSEELAQEEDEFYYKYATEGLMQYKYIGHAPADNGPIVFCIDESGSMVGPKNMFAKSMMYAMYMIAQKDKRAFHIVRFDDEEPICHEIKSAGDLLPILEGFLGGGTDFNKPLNKACEIIEKNPKYQKADVIFVTDGCSYVDPAVLNRISEIKKRLSFKIISTMIGRYHTEYLKPFSDKIFGIPDIYNADDFLNTVFEI